MKALAKASAGLARPQQLWLAPHQFSAPDKKSLLGRVRKTIIGITLLDATRLVSQWSQALSMCVPSLKPPQHLQGHAGPGRTSLTQQGLAERWELGSRGQTHVEMLMPCLPLPAWTGFCSSKDSPPAARSRTQKHAHKLV